MRKRRRVISAASAGLDAETRCLWAYVQGYWYFMCVTLGRDQEASYDKLV